MQNLRHRLADRQKRAHLNLCGRVFYRLLGNLPYIVICILQRDLKKRQCPLVTKIPKCCNCGYTNCPVRVLKEFAQRLNVVYLFLLTMLEISRGTLAETIRAPYFSLGFRTSDLRNEKIFRS